MALLTVNGIDLPVVEARRSQVAIGSSVRAFDGSPRVGRRKVRREWRFTSGPLDVVTSAALQGLVEGRGEHFPLDSDYFSDAGLGTFQVGAGNLFGGPGTLTGHGTYLAAIGYAANVYWKPTGGPTDANWTVIASAYHNDPSVAWWRWVIQAGAKWRNGVRDDANSLRTVWFDSTNGILYVRSAIYNGADWTAATVKAPGNRTKGTVGGNTYAFEVVNVSGDAKTGATVPTWTATPRGQVVDGNVTWMNTGGDSGAGNCGDLVWLPYVVPDAWVSQVNAFHNARPWSPLPRVYASGSFAGGAELLVLGEVDHVEASNLNNGATGEVVSFVLREI